MQKTMSEHAATAAKIATQKKNAGTVTRCTRQGDVMAHRIGDAARSNGTCPKGGWVVGKGQHGEHRVIAECGTVVENLIDLPLGGVLVHTDEPNARHAASTLIPGRWSFDICQELGIDGIVQKVQD